MDIFRMIVINFRFKLKLKKWKNLSKTKSNLKKYEESKPSYYAKESWLYYPDDPRSPPNPFLVTRRWVYNLGCIGTRVNLETTNVLLISYKKKHILWMIQDISLNYALDTSEHQLLKGMLINTVLDLRKNWNISIYSVWIENIYLYTRWDQDIASSIISELDLTFIQSDSSDPNLQYNKEQLFISDIFIEENYKKLIKTSEVIALDNFNLENLKLKPNKKKTEQEIDLQAPINSDELLKHETLIIHQKTAEKAKLDKQFGPSDVNEDFNKYIFDPDLDVVVDVDIDEITAREDFDQEEFEYQHD